MPPADSTGGPRPAELRSRRCVRHGAREAAGRCPSCGGFFCRECLVEHEGRLLCAACLARETAARARTAPGVPLGARIRSFATAAAGVFALWLLFFLIASVLVRLPPALHDGTVWNRPPSGDDEPPR